jgi:hypothetical protein
VARSRIPIGGPPVAPTSRDHPLAERSTPSGCAAVAISTWPVVVSITATTAVANMASRDTCVSDLLTRSRMIDGEVCPTDW